MRIGFDAKRAFLNFSGLGNYSRLVINVLSDYHPDNEYYLYIPHRWNKNAIQVRGNQYLRFPDSWIKSTFHPLWRSFLLASRFTSDKLDIYHGLSNELPFRLNRGSPKTVVTIHDLIFMRYPHWYPGLDRKIYLRKTRYSCTHADRIIAISEQTRSDLVDYFNIDKDLIDVVYQSCDPAFSTKISKKEIRAVLNKYDLPSEYMLYVGTIEERKNLLGLIIAIEIGSIDIPLVVVGRPTKYADRVKNYIAEKKIRHIYFLEAVPNKDLPALYQKASSLFTPQSSKDSVSPYLRP